MDHQPNTVDMFGNVYYHKVATLEQAVALVSRHHFLTNEVIVERYPTPQLLDQDLFSYQFISASANPAWDNCAVYIPDMQSVQVFKQTRKYLIGAGETRTIRPFLQRLTTQGVPL